MRKLPLTVLALSIPLWGAFACNGEDYSTVCKTGQVFKNNTCQEDVGVSLNGEGYLLSRRKHATYQEESASFTIKSAADGSVVYEGTATKKRSNDAEWDVYVADFSDLTTPGTYILEAGSEVSGEFQIGSDALDEALHAAMLSMYGQRCGEHVEFQYNGQHYEHLACHLAPASLERVGGGTKDDTGGWHDAGDYGKYVNNGAFSVGVMLKAWEDFPDFLSGKTFDVPETGGDTPDFLDEARVELEWLRKTQFENGSFAHKVTAAGFEANIMPEGDSSQRLFFSTSTPSTGAATAALAQAARIYEPFDSAFAGACLESARRGWEFLAQNTSIIQSDQIDGGTGTYGDSNDFDERLWALAELWETTGESEYLTALEEFVPRVGYQREFDWQNVGNLGLVTYALSEREGRDPVLVEGLQREIVETADLLASASAMDAYGRATDSYYWGTNGVIVRLAFSLIAGHRLYPNTAYLDAITAQIDHVLGNNPFGRSYVTQLGANPVNKPHHRPSVADSASSPWPGLLIGGPHGQGDLADPDLPPGLNWTDETSNYWHNEVAINWSTAFIYALVAARATSEDTSADCVPDCLPEPTAMGGAGGAN